MLAKQLSALQALESKGKSAEAKPSQEDPFRKIGRSEKIIVEYEDGRLLEGIKIKLVESDLRKGICKIIQA